MRCRLWTVAVALAGFAAVPHAADAPKLAVIIVVDQMRADYVDRFQRDWTGGLRRLIDEGAWFRRAAYPYLNTVTCSGHATISTGAYPMAHGVFQNQWFSRERAALVTCTDDPAVTAIPYGRGRAGHESAVNLKIPSFADEMRRQRQSHTVSLSFKARSAIMLAGHEGDAVTWLSESLDGWESSSAFATAPVPAVKAFVEANPIEADFGKTWALSMPANRYQSSDAGLGEAAPAGWTSTFPHLLGGQGQDRPDAGYYAQWERSPYADAYLGRMAANLVESMQLGRHDGTDLLAVSFSTPDLVGHAFGPNSVEVQDLYFNLDRTLGQLFGALDRAVGRDQWVVALSSDHGVAEIPEQRVAGGRDGGRLYSQAIALAVNGQILKELGGDPPVIRMVGNDIYLRPGLIEQLAAKPAALTRVLKAAQSQPGIQRAFGANQLTAEAAASKDVMLRAAALSYAPGRSGDIIVAPRPGWMIGTTGTTHGSATNDDQRVPLMFYGAGIRRGRYNDTASPADIVPTLASIVGITLPQAQGTPLSSALTVATTARPRQR
ncbi:MAG: alkaline phosphatase family protein [Vicinamibacterales bacterium]